jgi:oxaloacetate decarboxylase alpha subunit
MSTQGDEIQFVDQTIRDGQQSLWGHLMTTDMILPIAPVMDQVGYRHISIVGARGGVVAHRALHENIFERYRLLRKKITKTPLRSSFVTWSPSSFNVEHVATMELWIKCAVSCGIMSFWFVMYQNLRDRERYLCRVAKKEGADIAGAIMFQQSPVHTDELWSKKTREMIENCNIDVIQLEDTAGTLTPERTRTLTEAIRKEAKGIPIEFHTHCTAGVAPLCYVEAMKAGLRIVHTAVSPLANGPSLPSTENTISNAHRLGFTTNLDMEALKTESDHFRRVAEERGLPLGVPVEYNLSAYWHQIPGGMMGTMKNQLAEIGQEHRMEEVLEEVGRVRHELGYPVMATPFSQFVGAQALFNVTSGERYKIVSDEIIRYVLGHYGEPDGKVNPEVKDKILSSAKARKWLNWKEPELTVEDLRKLEPQLSDEELMLKIINPEGEFKDKLWKLYGWTS